MPEPDFVGYDAGPQCVRDQTAHEIKHHKELLEDYKKHVVETGAAACTKQLQGQTIDCILSQANDLECEMIIIGNNKHGFFHHLLHGNVTDSILAQSPIPVLLIPSD